MQSILGDLGKLVEPAPSAATTPPATPAPATPPAATTEPPPKPGEATPPAATTPPVPPPEPTKIKKAKPISEQVEGAVRKVLAEQTPPPAAPTAAPSAPPAAPTPDSNTEFDASLPEEDRQTLETAKFAEKQFSRKGLADEFRGFFRKVKAFQDKALTEDPARTLDENDEEYVKFIHDNKPDISTTDWRKFESQQASQPAIEEAKATKEKLEKAEARMNQVEAKQREIEFKPELEKALVGVEADLKSMIDETNDSPLTPIAKIMAEKGVEEAMKADPEIAPIILDAANMAMGNSAEYMAVTRGIRAFDPHNKHHLWLAKFVDAQCNQLIEKGGDDLKKTVNGQTKTFMPRGKLIALQQTNPEDAAKYWTFSDQEICRRLARNAQTYAEQTAKARIERLTAAGWTRKPASTAPPVSTPSNPPPPPAPSPKATTTTAPGPADGKVIVETAWKPEELSALGFPLAPAK